LGWVHLETTLQKNKASIESKRIAVI
jgi:hypothetical protein